MLNWAILSTKMDDFLPVAPGWKVLVSVSDRESYHEDHPLPGWESPYEFEDSIFEHSMIGWARHNHRYVPAVWDTQARGVTAVIVDNPLVTTT